MSQSSTWSPAQPAPVSDTLDVEAGNVSHVTVDAAPAELDCAVHLNVTTDGPLKVTMLDCALGGSSRTVSFH